MTTQETVVREMMRGSLVVFGCFFALLASVLVQHPSMFTKSHARRHRLVGLVYLSWLLLGFANVFFSLRVHQFAYHVVLGVLGVAVTLTAAFDFRFHDRVNNKASGTLEKHTTVTFDEMIEHSFYQGVNLVQIVALHCMELDGIEPWHRWALTMVSTAPWLLRSRFPVNSFSSNYKDLGSISSYSTEQLLYRIKKWQYVFYKHALLHGLAVSAATRPSDLTQQTLFELYWLALNASYVFEFFGQTLVKKRYMPQSTLLLLQKMLMGISSVCALFVLSFVRWQVALVSVALNFTNRGHDFVNTGLLLVLTVAFDTAVASTH